MAKPRLLIIDDEADIRKLLARILRLEDYQVDDAADGTSGKRMAASGRYDVVICDVRLPDANGLDLTREIKELVPATEVIQLTANGSIADGVQAVKNGAFDYLQKGDDNARLLPLVERAADKARAQRKLATIERDNADRHGFDQIIGESEALERAKHLARQVAPTDTSVLITGPTGTGKEVFAHAVHYASRRSGEPFVAVNCAAFGRELLESEMFGHVAGAFTGATRSKRGLFEEADGGTIFLDELGEMDLGLQAKLLRVLENGTFMKVGSTSEIQVDVRVVAATNRDLLAESEAGTFRLDLYYRLATFTVEIPSLNARGNDVVLLARHFVKTLAPGIKPTVHGLDRDFEQALLRKTWQGNVRELRNFIERTLILAKGDRLTAADLPYGFDTEPKHTDAGAPPRIDELAAVTMSDVERLHIERVLTMTGGNKSRAAELLKIGLTTLYRKIEEYGLGKG